METNNSSDLLLHLSDPLQIQLGIPESHENWLQPQDLEILLGEPEGVGVEDFLGFDLVEDLYLDIMGVDSMGIDGYVDSDRLAATASNSNSVIERLRRESFTADDLEDACSICLEGLSGPNPKQLMKLPCSHIFHESCILPWLDSRTTCPLCRSVVYQEDDVDIMQEPAVPGDDLDQLLAAFF